MQQSKKVIVIEPTIEETPITMLGKSKKRVAAYARVSTSSEEQLNSYDAQIEYYTDFIQTKPEWIFAGLYSDEGISGTSLKKRKGFNKMVSDALAGKIDLIITKSISRFARNTVDSLSTIRDLREKNVEVFFEKENLYTLDKSSELILQIFCSISQSESFGLSKNISWGIRKRFADGKVSLPYGQFLGYEKGEDNLPQIIEEEAKIVRRIYQMFLEGMSPSLIGRVITSEKIPTPGGKEIWRSTTVKSILTNEKYMGHAILQKCFTVDYLTKKQKKNEGEVPQYYVENSHPAIISPQVFEMVQAEIKRRAEGGSSTRADSCFSSRLVCSECGNFYGRKIWHSTNKYRAVVWHCNAKFQKKTYCKTPHLKEEAVKVAFTEAVNSMIKEKEELIANCEKLLYDTTDVKNLTKKDERLLKMCKGLEQQLESLIAENACRAIDQKEYQEKYDTLAYKHNAFQRQRKELASKIESKKAQQNQIDIFIKELRQRKTMLTEFDENLWKTIIRSAQIGQEGSIIFSFKDGTTLPWQMEV